MDLIVNILALLSLFFLFVYVSIFIHELGHYFTARLLRAKKVRLSVKLGKSPKFSTIINFGRPMSYKEDLLITSAGVVFQLSFSLIIIYLDVHPLLTFIILIHLPTIVFNLLPYSPLDGYYLLKLHNTNRAIKRVLFSLYYSFTTYAIGSIIYNLYMYQQHLSYLSGIILAFSFFILCKTMLRIRFYKKEAKPWTASI